FVGWSCFGVVSEARPLGRATILTWPSLTVGLLTLSSPQSLLQFNMPFDNFFLDQMLALRHNGFAVHNNLLHRCSGQRKNNRRQEIISRRPGDRGIIKIDRKEVRWPSSLEHSTRCADAASAVDRRAIKQ